MKGKRGLHTGIMVLGKVTRRYTPPDDAADETLALWHRLKTKTLAMEKTSCTPLYCP